MKRAVLGLLLSVTTMVVIGIVMLFSTGAFSRDAYKVKKNKPQSEAVAAKAGDAPAKPGAEKPAAETREILWDPASLVKRQAMWLGFGILACIAATLVDYHFWQRAWPWLFGLAVALLALCFVFPKINGAHRWIRFGAFSFQPSEIGKIAVISFLAAWCHRYEAASREWLKGLVYPFLIACVIMGLIAPEKDLGTTAVIGVTTLVMLFVAGAKFRYLTPLPALGLAALAYEIIHNPERLRRIAAFLDLENHKEGDGYQQLMGLVALGSGGPDGLGLGNGRQKFMYLPEAHTDFIFPTIGEELGLVFTLLIVFCYVIMIISGFAISLNARDRFGILMGTGITTMIACQAAMNIGVTTALLPNKGIPLPFISYGGSNLLFCLFAVGILLNIYRKGDSPAPARAKTKPRPLMTPRI